MTAGLPGTGIGGMFYLLSALLMPLRQIYLRLRRRDAAGEWRVIAAQMSIAGGILGGMWVAGWVLGRLFRAAEPVAATAGVSGGNVLGTATFALALGTLAAVLCGVQVLRLVVPRARAGEPAAADAAAIEPVSAIAGSRRRKFRRRVTLALLATLTYAQPIAAARDEPVTVHLARADSALAAGNRILAEREYAAVLRADPGNSRATYRLADLLRARDPRQALNMFRRYVELEATDPWGYMAVGSMLARMGRHGAALKWYDAALRLAPVERDAVIGRARVLVRDRRISAAIATYQTWLSSHPSDAEARTEMARLRAGAAAVVAPSIGGSRASDGNGTFRVGATLESPLLGDTRLGVVAALERVGDATRSHMLQEIGLRVSRQVGAGFRLDAGAGAAVLSRSDTATIGAGPPRRGGRWGEGVAVIPTGQLRVRWRAPTGGPSVDVRGQHGVLAANPLMLDSRMTRSDLRLTAELPLLRPIRLRGIGRASMLSDTAGANYRTSVGGGFAFAVRPAAELSLQGQEMRFARASNGGYFAPRVAQLVEAGCYVEIEAGSRAVFAVDAGVGMQRSAQFGAVIGPWGRALRFYSLVAVRLASRSQLQLELETEDSPLANEAATSAEWRYVAANLSVRWGF